MRALKILMISSLYPPYVIGGAELVAAYLAEHLAQLGHEVAVITTAAREEVGSQRYLLKEMNGVKVFQIYPSNKYWMYQERQASLTAKVEWHIRDTWNRDALGKIREIIRLMKPDIVHTHNIVSLSPMVWRQLQKLGLPVVHTSHDYHLLCPRTTLLRRNGHICTDPTIACRIFSGWNISRTADIDLFVAPSAFHMEQHKLNGCRARAYKVIRNGIPFSLHDLHQVHRRPQLKAQREGEPLAVLYMGQLASHKGLQTLLDAFAGIAEDLPLMLDIAGNGPMEGIVREAAGRDSRIRFHGFVTGAVKDRLLARSDVIVLPSIWYENAPISIIEALTTGILVITSDMGGLSEITVHMESGLNFEAGNAAQLRSLLILLAQTPELIQRLLANARQLAPNYSVQRMTEQYLAAYRQLLYPESLAVSD